MFPSTLKTFAHPHQVYKLEYPAHWDALTQKDGESCGFGPHDRDDVGLWISLLPMSVDTEKLAEELPNLFRQSLHKAEAANVRRDESLRHYGLVADMTKEGEGGHYWIVAGGDIVLFASSQVPAAERDVWNPPFQQLMTSLRINRDDALVMRQIANEVLIQLRKRDPEQEFDFDGDKIRGKNQVVFLSNLYREVRSSPARRDQIVKRFVETLCQPGADLGYEEWSEVRTCVLPILKPRDYIAKEGPTQHILTREWLAEVLICYAISRKKMIRFITGWDLRRWGVSEEQLHEQSIGNLTARRWPRELMGASFRGSGRVIVVDTDDGLSSSRLLHPDLHKMFSGPLGSPFWAGIPCRDRLVLFSDRRELKQRIGRRLRKDHASSAYSITERPFLVTRDGIAPPLDK